MIIYKKNSKSYYECPDTIKEMHCLKKKLKSYSYILSFNTKKFKNTCMYGETLFECSLSIARLAILSTQPMLKPRKIITNARNKIFFETGMNATQSGIIKLHIIRKFKIETLI